MNFINEYSLLVAVVIPGLAIAGLNLFLVLGGERDTLLLPFARPYPAVEGAAGFDETPAATASSATIESANDEHASKAA